MIGRFIRAILYANKIVRTMEATNKLSLNGTGVLSYEPSLQALKSYGELTLIEPLSHKELVNPFSKNRKEEFNVCGDDLGSN